MSGALALASLIRIAPILRHTCARLYLLYYFGWARPAPLVFWPASMYVQSILLFLAVLRIPCAIHVKPAHALLMNFLQLDNYHTFIIDLSCWGENFRARRPELEIFFYYLPRMFLKTIYSGIWARDPGETELGHVRCSFCWENLRLDFSLHCSGTLTCSTRWTI